MDNNISRFGGYNVDICLCIDKTNSMVPFIDMVKQKALNLYRDVLNSLQSKGQNISQFRTRVIWFGDYIADDVPMLVSEFLKMPDDLAKYEEFVKSVNPNGGGDAPEDGLEALTYAIRSDWVKTGWRKRHIIALFTDAPSHELGFGKKDPSYPKHGMPEDFGELSEMWGSKTYPGEMDNSAKRLLLFAPYTSFWHAICELWDNVVLSPMSESTGLKDITYQVMLDTITSCI